MTDQLPAERQNGDGKREPVRTGTSLGAIVPENLDQAYRLAQALSRAGDMVPEDFRGNPEKTMAAVVKGMEIGLAPMQSLASIAVINGRPSIWGDALPALMLRAGHHIDVEIEGEGDARTAVATLERGDTGRTIVRRFSIADAKRANLVGNPKKPIWAAYPDRMLAMRARSWAIRDGAADALMGLAVREEVEDYGPDKARDVTPSSPRKGGVVYRSAAPQPEPEPVVDEVFEHDVIEDDASGPTDREHEA